MKPFIWAMGLFTLLTIAALRPSENVMLEVVIALYLLWGAGWGVLVVVRNWQSRRNA